MPSVHRCHKRASAAGNGVRAMNCHVGTKNWGPMEKQHMLFIVFLRQGLNYVALAV